MQAFTKVVENRISLPPYSPSPNTLVMCSYGTGMVSELQPSKLKIDYWLSVDRLLVDWFHSFLSVKSLVDRLRI